jgi:hypothetical protein
MNENNMKQEQISQMIKGISERKTDELKEKVKQKY